MKKAYYLYLGCVFACIFNFAPAQTPIRSFQSVSATYPFKDNLILVASDGVSGEEAWVSDGTREGTLMLKDIRAGYPASSPKNFFEFNNKVYFSAYSDQFQEELWVTDGTSGGTTMVADLLPFSDYWSGSSPASFIVFNDRLHFTTSDGKLYRANAAVDAFEMVDKLGYMGRITNLHVIGDRLYYYKSSDILHWTDGTTIGDIDLPLDIEGTYFQTLYSSGGLLYALRASSGNTHLKLYVLNNVTHLWTKIFDLKAPSYGSHNINDVTAMDGQLFFNLQKSYDNSALDELWRTNGTSEGTLLLKSFSWDRHSASSDMQSFAVMDHQLLFRVGNAGSRALWKTNGTVDGTVKVHDVIMGESSPGRPAIIDGRLYFAGSSGIYDPASLWSTDGTTAGTRQEFALSSNRGSTPVLLTPSHGLVFFISREQFLATVWNNAPAAEINVAINNSDVSYLSNTYFTVSEENGCSSKILKIRNDGKKALALGSVQIIGQDFLLDGNLPEMLLPGTSTEIKIWYYPSLKQTSTATLSIASSDANEAPYILNLNGTSYEEEPSGRCTAFANSFTRFLAASQGSKPFTLSTNTLAELEPAGTVVGTFSYPGATATYSLAEGDGDTHNHLFNIDGSSLKASRTFVYGEQNNYTIRIKATKADQSVSEATFTISIADRPNVLAPGECEKVIERLDYQFTGLAVNSQGKLFAITNDGQIQHSADGGHTWTSTYLGFTPRLYQIFFVGDTGFVLGDVMLKSDDNGSTWFQLYTPEPGLFSTMSAFFLDEEKGFFAGNNGNIHFTDDGGRTWTQRHAGYSYSDNFSNLFFLNEEKGFATRSYRDVFKTTDGGRTWTALALGSLGYIDMVTDVHFLNENEGWILTYSALYKTSNGGTSWEKVSAITGSSLRSIQFVNDQKGFIIGEYLVYKTDNRGSSWSSFYSPDGSIKGLAMKGADLYTAHGSNFNYAENGRALYVSHDDGTNWETLQDIDDRHIFALSFPTAQIGFACSEYANYKTTDGGVTWKPVSWTTRMGSMHFFDENKAIFTDQQNVYRSEDGGENITLIYTIPNEDGSYRSFGRLYAVNENLIFSYTYYTILRSDDGGVSWSSTDLPATLTSIRFLSATVGFAQDLLGDLYKTTDAGITWNRIFERDPFVSNVHQDVFFLNENVGYRAGDNFSKTTDGGQTWQDIFDPFQTGVYRIFFTSEMHGYAVLHNSQFFETSDGGITWKQHFATTSQSLTTVEFRNNAVYFAGVNGFISQFKNFRRPPLQPGYISGQTTVCAGDVQQYDLARDYAGTYRWQVAGTLVHEDESSVQVHFSNTGQQVFTVTSANSCGTSDPRSVTVDVKEMVPPVITGSVLVPPFSEEVYEIENPLPSATYFWTVSTDVESTLNESATEITINWPQADGIRSIEVVAWDWETGCRVKGDLEVDVSLTVLVEEDVDNDIALFPNPASARVTLTSETMGLVRIDAYDINGRFIFTQDLVPYAANTLSVSEMPQGVYILKLYGADGKMSTKKLVRK